MRACFELHATTENVFAVPAPTWVGPSRQSPTVSDGLEDADYYPPPPPPPPPPPHTRHVKDRRP